MNTTRKTFAALGMLLALALTAVRAQATQNPAYLDLQVTFSGALSIAVDGAQSSARTLASVASNAQIVSSAVVTNDGNFTEQWQLSVSTLSGGGNWAVTTTTTSAPGVDTYALQAMFISSDTAAACPAPDWDLINNVVSGTAQTYDQTLFADTNFGGIPDETNGNMYSTDITNHGKRNLCVRFYAPKSSTKVATQVVRLTLTAQAGT
jgi:hypothetical protein